MIPDDVGYDPSVIQIQDRTEIDFVFFNSNILVEFRYIRKPFLVWSISSEFPVQYIFSYILRIW